MFVDGGRKKGYNIGNVTSGAFRWVWRGMHGRIERTVREEKERRI